MTDKKATKFEEFEKTLLEKPDIRREYEALQPKYDLIQTKRKQKQQNFKKMRMPF